MKGPAIITTPVVPRYEPTERTSALQTPRAQGVGADAFGGGLARGVGQAAGDYMGYLRQEKEKADRVAAIESRTALDQVEVDLLYDPNKGALAARGKDAFALPEPVLQKYGERTAEIERNLTTPEQKETFRLLAQQRRVEMDKQLQRHVSGEMKIYAQETVKSSLASTLNNIATHYQDPARLEQERKFGLAVLMTDADNQGLPPASVKLKAQTWESMVHSAVIDKIAIDSPLRAKDYLEANRENMLPGEVTKIEASLKPLAEAQEAQAAADEIFYGAPDESIDNLVKTARERFVGNPDVGKAAENQIRSLYTTRKEAERQAVTDAEDTVYGAIAKVKQGGGVPTKADVPQAAWNRLAQVSPDSVLKIMDYLSVKKTTEETPGQLQNWANLVSDPQSLMAANLDEIYAKGLLADARYMDLVRKKKEIKDDPDKDVALRTELQTVDQVLKGASLKKGTEKYTQAMDYIEGRKRAFQMSSGRGPTRKELEDITREALYVSGGDDWKPFNEKPAYQMTIEDVPSAEREGIRKALSDRGYPSDDAWVISSYVRFLNSKGAK
jgi:hypothetical protein